MAVDTVVDMAAAMAAEAGEEEDCMREWAVDTEVTVDMEGEEVDMVEEEAMEEEVMEAAAVEADMLLQHLFIMLQLQHPSITPLLLLLRLSIMPLRLLQPTTAMHQLLHLPP